MMEPTLFGLEQELAWGVADGQDRARVPVLANAVIQTLSTLTEAVRCAENPPNLPGIMLSNGMRIYIDGHYMESAGPEALTPEDVLAFQRAGELLLLRALPNAAARAGINPDRVTLVRASTDYQEHYYGTHLNVLLRRHGAADLASRLIPFLVTRFYSYAGGLGAGGFVMSQKRPSVACAISSGARENRAIINTKQESLSCAPYQRFHLTFNEGCMSELGSYLTVATSGLVLKMLDDGAIVGPSCTLLNPIATLKTLDCDPSFTKPLPLACGLKASGLQIQRHYLEAAEAYVRRDSEEWMRRAVVKWREALDALQKGPQSLARSLDPYIKLRLYRRMVEKHGMTMEEFSGWCAALWLLRPYLSKTHLPRRGLRDRLRERVPSVTFGLLEERMERHRLSWSMLGRAQELWNRAIAMEFRYHDIKPDGLYWALRDKGIVNTRIVNDHLVHEAMTQPPEGTRAKRRGQAIREVFRDRKATATWSSVITPTRTLDLRHPYNMAVEWEPKSGASK